MRYREIVSANTEHTPERRDAEFEKKEHAVNNAIKDLVASYQEKIERLETEVETLKESKEVMSPDGIKIPTQEEINKMSVFEMSNMLNWLEKIQGDIETAISALNQREQTIKTETKPPAKPVETRDISTPEEKRFQELKTWVQTNLASLTECYKRERPLPPLPSNLMARSNELKDGIMAIETQDCHKKLVIVRPGKYISLQWFDGGPANERVESNIKPAVLEINPYNKNEVKIIERGEVKREER